MAKFWNWAKDETSGERTLRLEGIIFDDDFWADIFGGTTAKQFRDELNAGKGNVTVWINSDGGDVFAAAEIYNMLKEYGDNHGLITVKIDAIAASAASVIAMAGDFVEISPVGAIFIHNPWTSAEGDSAEMKTVARMLDEVKESIINAYELKTKMPRDKISRLMDAETHMNAYKAVELGFADKVMYTDNQTQTAQAFSRRAVMNCMTDAIKLKLAAEKKATPDNRVDAAQRHKNLNLLRIKQWRS